jgi:hypothetical protein
MTEIMTGLKNDWNKSEFPLTMNYEIWTKNQSLLWNPLCCDHTPDYTTKTGSVLN